MLPSFLNTFPCALISEQVTLPYSDATVGSNVLQALDNITSLHFTLKSSNCGPEFVKILTYLKEKGSVLNEISIRDEENLNMDFTIPAIPCRRVILETKCFTSLFNCAYHPYGSLQSLHISSIYRSFTGSNLWFDSEISKAIEHNCQSLLELQMCAVKVAKNSALLLQETFQKCHALVTLSIANVNDGTLASVGLHELFCSMQGLVSLECLHVSSRFISVFGEDLCALHNLLYQGVPKLKECHLSFEWLVIYFKLLTDPKFEPIQELLAVLLSGKEPSPDHHAVTFIWENNQMVHTWLANLCCGVNFKLMSSCN